MKINNLYDCIIIGSGPAGLTAGIYLGRAGYKVLCVTGSEPGGTLNKISIIENYPGYPDGIAGIDLAQNMLNQANKFGIEFAYFTSVKEYEKDGDNHPIKITLDNDTILYSKSLINCAGGKPLTLGLKNEENFFNRGISFCATCDGPLYKGKDVAVIGGGNSAMEFASTLAKYCKKVYIIHRRDVLRADSTMISKAINNSNVDLILGYNVKELLSSDTQVISGLVCESSNGSLNKINVNVSAAFYAIGYESTFIPCRIGGMNSGTFSAGDVRGNFNKYKQVIYACGDGCAAALDCIKFLQELNIKENFGYSSDVKIKDE